MIKKVESTQQAKIDKLIAEQQSIRDAVQQANDTLKEVTARSIAATSTRDDFQTRCTAMAQSTSGPRPDFSKLGQLTVAAITAFDAVAPAQAALDAANASASARLGEIDNELLKLHHEMKKAAFSELVVEYESRIVAAGLGKLSDEIRSAGFAAGIPMENHSPLINADYLMIGGYPLQVWG